MSNQTFLFLMEKSLGWLRSQLVRFISISSSILGNVNQVFWDRASGAGFSLATTSQQRGSMFEMVDGTKSSLIRSQIRVTLRPQS